MFHEIFASVYHKNEHGSEKCKHVVLSTMDKMFDSITDQLAYLWCFFVVWIYLQTYRDRSQLATNFISSKMACIPQKLSKFPELSESSNRLVYKGE